MKRIGNVIGTPVEPTSSSASGCFRITAQQQRNINASFPKKDVRGDNPRDVSIMAFQYSALSGGTYHITGEMILRFAAPDNWIDRSDYSTKVNGIGNGTSHASYKYTDENDNSFAESGYTAIVTNHTTGQVEEFHVTSTMGSIISRDYTSTGDSSQLPRFESPLTFDDKHVTFSLREFNPAAGGDGLSGTYTAQVFSKSAEMGERNPNDTSINNPTAANYSNSAICTRGIRQVDIVLVSGGAAGGRLYNPGSNSSRDFGTGGGGAGGVLIGYNVPVEGGIDYVISVGQGGDTNGASAGIWNGTGSSALGCYIPGGGHGAFMDFINNSAGVNMLPAGNGACGGGSVSRDHVSNAGRIAGRAGLSTISASSTLVVGGMYELHGKDGGYLPGSNNFISEGNANANGLEAATVNSTYAFDLGYNGTAWRKAVGQFGNSTVGCPGGGAGAYGGSIEAGIDGNPGIYISWATPDLAHTSLFTGPIPVSADVSLPQIDGIPYVSSYTERHIGDQGGPRANSQKGYFGGSGSSERQEGPGKGGGGIGRRLRNNITASDQQNVAKASGGTMTISANAVAGTGGSGGAIWSDNLSGSYSTAWVAGGLGASGIVLVRVPRKAAYTVTRSVDDQLYPDQDYIIYVWRGTDPTDFIRFST